MADRLLALLPQAIARVSVSESGRFDGPEPAELWGLEAKGGKDVLVRPPATSMYLRDFFELLQEPGTSETFYLEYLALHQYLGAVPFHSPMNRLRSRVRSISGGGGPHSDAGLALCQHEDVRSRWRGREQRIG